VPGGGLSPDGSRWIACRPGYFLPVEVLSALFRGLMLSSLRKAHKAGKLQFFGDRAGLADRKAFAAFLRPWATADWVVYAKEPLAGPEHVLRYLSRYTHRVAISNRRLIAADENGVTFRYKDYRIDGPGRYTTMTLDTHEPKGVHRISFSPTAPAQTTSPRCESCYLLRLLPKSPRARRPRRPIRPARRMLIIEVFQPGCEPKHRPSSAPRVVRIDTS
jgi:hypothetical protein